MAGSRDDWHLGKNGVRYPPEPWYLGGNFYVSAFRVRTMDLPRDSLDIIPRRHKLLTLRGKATVAVAFVHYFSGGVLRYDELLVAYTVISGGKIRYSIPQIWVTSESSMCGGRELWGIPKDLGDFDRTVDGTRVTTRMNLDGQYIASLTSQPGRALLPGWRQIPLPTAQLLDGHTSLSTNRVLARVRSLSAQWNFDPAGCLGYLAGRTPFISIAATEAAVLFGMAVTRS